MPPPPPREQNPNGPCRQCEVPTPPPISRPPVTHAAPTKPPARPNWVFVAIGVTLMALGQICFVARGALLQQNGKQSLSSACFLIGSVAMISGVVVLVRQIKQTGPGPRARFEGENLVCADCGSTIRFTRKPTNYDGPFRHFGLLGVLLANIATPWEHRCPNCGLVDARNLPFLSLAKERATQILLVALAILIAAMVINAATPSQNPRP